MSPWRDDKLFFVRTSKEVVSQLKVTIQNSWEAGLAREEWYNVGQEPVQEMKFNGNPWDYYEDADNSLTMRRLMLEMLGTLGSLHFKLVNTCVLDAGTDSMFFIQDENYRMNNESFAMVSLHGDNKIRLTNCEEQAEEIVRVIEANGFKVHGYIPYMDCEYMPTRKSPHNALPTTLATTP